MQDGTHGWANRVGATERVFVRPPEPTDREPFTELVKASLDFLRPWEPWLSDGPQASAASRFDRLMALGGRADVHKLLVCRCTDGVILGQMNVNNIVRGVFQSAALGYWIGAPYARAGYSTEALQVALHHTFRSLALHRVEANIKPENTASIALVERAGFRDEGYSPQFLKIAGAWADHRRFAMLADEWTPLHSVTDATAR